MDELELSNVPVDPTLIKELSVGMSERIRHDPDADQLDSFELAAFTLKEILPDGAIRTSLAMAIIERMACLGRLMNDERMRGWIRKIPYTKTVDIDDSLFEATATCPMPFDGKRFNFDAEEFFRLALIAREDPITMTRFVCNLNDQVFVRLTPIGAKVWLGGWPGGIPKETRERLTQPDGSIRFQLRQLLEIFGPTIFYSANHPYFEGNNLTIESSQQ